MPGEIARGDTESEYAWSTAAAMLSSAGPVVTMATPGTAGGACVPVRGKPRDEHLPRGAAHRAGSQ